MPRFSEQAIEVFTTFFTNIHKETITDQLIKEQLSTLNDPLDRCFASFKYIRYFFYSQMHAKGLELLKSVEEENNKIQDYFIGFLVITWNVLYYHGINSPAVDLEKGREYLKELHLVYQEQDAIDEWEKNYIEIWYHLVLSLIETNPDKMLELAEKTIQNYDVFTDERFKPDSMAPKIILGSALTLTLRFLEAKEVFLEVLEFLEKNNFRHLVEWTYGELANLELILGNLDEAQKYSEIQEKLSKELKYTFTLRSALDIQASVKIQQKKFDEAEKLLERSLELRKKDNDEWYIYIGYYALFMLHYECYKSSGDKIYLQKAQQIQEALQKQFANTNNERVQNFVEFTQAIINKHGSISKKGASIQALNRLDSIY
jgi:tetratricopeptide (TPR) repeat protein